MKKSELKSMIKECVREVLFEDGTLSDIITEIAFGITRAQGLVVESPVKTKSENELRLEDKNRRERLTETKQKMVSAIGGESMKGVFEGTQPLSSGGSEGPPSSPMAGVDPNDAGININGLLNVVGNRWKNLK